MLVIQPELKTALRVQLAARVRDMATAADVDGIAPDAIVKGQPIEVAEPTDRIAEVAQHLRNLGYIDVPVARQSLHDGGAPMHAGYRAFAIEARQWLMGATRTDPSLPKAIDDAIAQDRSQGPLRLNALIVELLRTLTSLDGEFAIAASPVPGQRGLVARVAQFRLGTYGFYGGDIDGVFGSVAEQAMTRCLNVLSGLWPVLDERPPGVLIDWLGDVPFLLRACARRGKLANAPVVVRTFLTTFADAGFRDIGGGGLFGLSRKSGFAVEADGRAVWIGDGDASVNLREQEADFTLCLVQNALWATGYYDGRLDGIWNAKSVVALKRAVHGVEIGATGPVSTVDTNLFAIWLPELADTLLEPAETLDAIGIARPSPASEIARQRQVADSVERRMAASPAARTGLFGWIRGLFEEAVALGRSVMVGARSLMRAALDAVRRGIDFLADVADFLIGKVKSLALLVYRSAREAVLALSNAIAPIRHFLFGVPIVSSDQDGVPYAATKVRIDRDVEQWVAATADGTAIAQHADLYQRLSRTFAGTIRLAILFAKLAIVGITGPVGWAMAALSFARVVSDMVPR